MTASNQLIAACNSKVLGDLTKSIILPNGGTVSVNREFSVGDNSTAGTYTEYFGINTSGVITTAAGGFAPTDVVVFAGAEDWSSFSSGAASVLTRLAGGNIAWVQAASVTVDYVLNVGQYIGGRTTAGKGFKLTSFDLVYLPITASLTSITPTLYKTTYANNTAAVIASTGAGLDITAGTNTLTVPSTGPWVFTQTVTSPAFFNPSGDQILQLDVAIVTPGTAVPNFYGAYLRFTTVPL